jgi:uncharacterized protein (TIGR03086 family)
MDPREALSRAITSTEPIIRDLREDQLDAPTPCGEWNVRKLVAHLIGQIGLLEARLRGTEPRHAVAPGALPQDDVVGDNPFAAFAEATGNVLEAARDASALADAGMIAGAITTDILVHGWDLARATDHDVEADEDLAGHLLALTEAGITDDNRGTMFGPKVDVRDGAPASDRLLGLLGRQPFHAPAR